MTALQGSPRFTGFIRRLVDEGHISAENMQQAMLSAKKANQDIVAYLVSEIGLSGLTIAETISIEFAEPVFDISAYDASQIIREGLDEKLITRFRVLPIFKHSNVLFVATSNPTNIDAIDAIRFSSKMQTEAIIVEHTHAFLDWLAAREVVPVVRALRDHGERVRRHAIAAAEKRLARGEDPRAEIGRAHV